MPLKRSDPPDGWPFTRFVTTGCVRSVDMDDLLIFIGNWSLE